MVISFLTGSAVKNFKNLILFWRSIMDEVPYNNFKRDIEM